METSFRFARTIVSIVSIALVVSVILFRRLLEIESSPMWGAVQDENRAFLNQGLNLDGFIVLMAPILLILPLSGKSLRLSKTLCWVYLAGALAYFGRAVFVFFSLVRNPVPPMAIMLFFAVTTVFCFLLASRLGHVLSLLRQGRGNCSGHDDYTAG